MFYAGASLIGEGNHPEKEVATPGAYCTTAGLPAERDQLMTTRSFNRIRLFGVFVLALASTSVLAQDQTPAAQEQTPAKHKTPFSYQIDIGVVAPTGPTKSSGGYNSSFMIGGGIALPFTKWIVWDMANFDFGFGTTNHTQTINVSNGTTATNSNYQMLF